VPRSFFALPVDDTVKNILHAAFGLPNTSCFNSMSPLAFRVEALSLSFQCLSPPSCIILQHQTLSSNLPAGCAAASAYFWPWVGPTGVSISAIRFDHACWRLFRCRYHPHCGALAPGKGTRLGKSSFHCIFNGSPAALNRGHCRYKIKRERRLNGDFRFCGCRFSNHHGAHLLAIEKPCWGPGS